MAEPIVADIGELYSVSLAAGVATMNYPANVATGDVLLAYVPIGANGLTVTDPNGWTDVTPAPFISDGGGTSLTLRKEAAGASRRRPRWRRAERRS